VPHEGVPLVLYHKEDDAEEDALLVTFQARRSNFLEKITKAWHDYASHPQFSGKPARMAIQVCACFPNGEKGTVRVGGGTDWLIQGELETQEAANALWEHVVKMWASIKDKPWLRNA
jgi:hypothetical protein